ncbi:MAG TPA: cytochrome c oxidase subunit I [Longimicrobiales bacterium]
MTTTTYADDPQLDRIAQERAELEHTYRREPGVLSWLADTDHKSVGLRIVVTAFVMFSLAGLLAAGMRAQLAQAENTLLGPEAYNQFFTMHGTTMMFLFAVPVMLGMGTYFVPLMIGTREVAFPKLIAFAYWTYLIGCLLLWVGFLTGNGPDEGWFSYAPLSEILYSPGKGVDIWSQTVTFSEVSGIALAINLIVTILKCRTPGMSLNRMPIFVWSMLVTSFMVVFAMTSVATATIFLASDRLIDTKFFDPTGGGDALLWQHLFWYFAHPEVYIIFLPATGMMSEMITTYTRRPIFGYTAVVFSQIAIGLISFGVWVHHMFATGLPELAASFFSAATFAVVLPTGVQIFCWLATIWAGKPRFSVPFLWALGFFFVFVRGGLTGVIVASVPLDTQVHDTFFVVAHLHDVLIGGAVFPLLGALWYWWPKWTGRLAPNALGYTAFALVFIGQNLTFFPMHIAGLEGQPRRVYTYMADSGWQWLNQLETIGALFMALGMLTYLIAFVVSFRRGAVAGSNPWDGPTFEWAAESPPARYNFVRQPVAEGRDAMWCRVAGTEPPHVIGMPTDRRELLLTTVLDAVPHRRKKQPGPSIWPFLTALAVGVMFVFVVWTPWAILVGSALLLPAMLMWGWPRRSWHGPFGAEHPE